MKRKVKIASMIGIVASGINLIFNGWHIIGIIALAFFVRGKSSVFFVRGAVNLASFLFAFDLSVNPCFYGK